MRALLNRLTLKQKYLFIGLIVAIMTLVPAGMIVGNQLSMARAATAAAAQMNPARETLGLIRLTQQLRGLSNAALNGDLESMQKAADTHATLQQAYARLEGEMLALAVDRGVGDTLQNHSRRISSLSERVQARNVAPLQSFTEYSSIITQQMDVLREMLAATGLDLDAYPDTRYLITGLFGHLPQLTEMLGQIRGAGSGMLARSQVTDTDRHLITALTARATDSLQYWMDHLNMARRNSRALADAMQAAPEDAYRASRAAIELAQHVIVSAGVPSYAAQEFFRNTSKAIDAQFALASRTASILEALLRDRATRVWTQLWLIILGLTLLAACTFALTAIITRSILSSLNASLTMARTVAQGDLTSRTEAEGKDEVQELLRALNDMSGGLVHIVSQVRSSTDNIATAAGQIAAGNKDLSQRTVSQAASLEETAASMEQLTSAVTHNSENARAAHVLTGTAAQVVSQAADSVQQLVATMSTIRETSSRITDIIGIIDGIAFQTNILALNAAVEAARAGEAGKGFNVVAAEVRNLAQRSALSAQEVRELIAGSTSEVDAGNQLASVTGNTMQQVHESIHRIHALMDEIAMASEEQSSGIAQVNLAVNQMDSATQQNAALVEEADAAAHSLEEQANRLVEAVSKFRLPGELRTRALELGYEAGR